MADNEISKKKICFPLTENVERYLKKYDRVVELPISYQDLMQYEDYFPLGDTLWATTMYSQENIDKIHKGLCYIYALLKTDGDMSVMEHLRVDSVDFCLFGNSHPFRAKIINNFNDIYTYFYIKKNDLSRIVGLELEDILSPNRINYFVDKDTLVEEHIWGIPGDDFLKTFHEQPRMNQMRLAKEFIKFNERCFYTLLGDMRAYNYVVELTHDFDNVQYRIRAIDFDQQCYEGRKNLYFPQYYKENFPMVKLAMELINSQTVHQYQIEERSRLLRRMKHSRRMLKDLFDTMDQETLSTPDKIQSLAEDLAKHHQDSGFLKCNTMAQILKRHLLTMVHKHK